VAAISPCDPNQIDVAVAVDITGDQAPRLVARRGEGDLRTAGVPEMDLYGLVMTTRLQGDAVLPHIAVNVPGCRAVG